MRATISLLVLAAGLMPASSLAGPAQSSEDIIKFFASTA
ncbi:OmpA family protein, partial [Mesorhizobium sp. M4B.F.Ca.ET.049.02.1.2]